jgi:two-component system CheB/CheR fusion protein
MATTRKPSGDARDADLRERAKQRLEAFKKDVSNPGGQDTQALIEEVEIHQAELAIQNDELQASEAALRTARDRYRDLFERAPI